MRKLLFIIGLSIFGMMAHATPSRPGIPSNRDLIEGEILGHVFCYVDDSRAGWFFSEDGRAVRHAVNIGMPGPGSFYQLTFVESPRTYGSFDLISSGQKLHFQYSEDGILHEYETGRMLSVQACPQRSR